MSQRQIIRKSIIQAYQRMQHGHLVNVGAYDKASPKAIAGALAKRYAHALEQPDMSGAGGGHPKGAESHAAAALPGATPNAAEAPKKAKKKYQALDKEAQHEKKTKEAAAARMARRRVLEKHHGLIQRARHYESLADHSATPAIAADYKAKAQGLRAPLEQQLGPEYERAIESRLIANYTPEIAHETADWASKVGFNVTRDEHGRPTGNFGQLFAEAQGKAYEVMHRHTSDNKTALIKQIRGTVQQHLFRHWRNALGAGGVNLSQADNADMSKLSKFQHAYFTQHGTFPADHQLAAHLDTDKDRIQYLKGLQSQLYTASWSDKAGSDESDQTLADVTGSSAADPAEQVEQNETVDAVGEAIASLDSPLKRAAVKLKYQMGLEPGDVQDLIDHFKLGELAHALQGATVAAGQGADAKAIAAHAAGQADGPKFRQALALIEHGGDPVALITRPQMLTSGAKEHMSQSELWRRLGLDAGNAGSTLRDAMKAIAKHPKVAAIGEAMQKSFTALPGPVGALVADLVAHYGHHLPGGPVDALVKSLAAAPPEGFEGLIESVTEIDPTTGDRRIRGDRRDEAVILAAAFEGDGHAALQGDR